MTTALPNAATDVVPSLVAAAAHEAPGALAIVDGGIQLTYGHVVNCAQAVSAQLLSLGVQRGDAVGVCLPRSAAQIVAALGVLNCGAAYVPLDPALPGDRLRSALTNCGATVVLSAANVIEQPHDRSALAVIRLAADGTITPRPDAARSVSVPLTIAAADLAYIIYTSGSTGRPKGVEITHCGLANLCAWHRAAFDLRPTDRAAHAAAVGFDAAVWEVWPYLATGACVYVAADETARDPHALRDWLLSNAITIAFAVTPLAERLIELDFPADTSLRVLLTGADTLHARPPASLPFALHNNYGPTEATVVATSGRVVPGVLADGLPSIGFPIEGTRIFIRTEDGVMAAAGTAGEILIAGAGLARGYRGDPELTAATFRSLDIDGSAVRVYHSGDRGRRERDGSLTFLGRLDDQIKLRGFRVEPREIEAVLNTHPDVRESAVVVREFGVGDERLVAFIVARAGRTLAVDDIVTALSVHLPAFMLPAIYVEVATLPLTTNGKIDRADLRAREITARLGAVAPVGPRTPTEERVMRLVATLLKLDAVGIDDDFFTLGGHSLLGTQLIARLRDTFGVTLGLRFLFESPTVAALAREVDRQQSLLRVAPGAAHAPADAPRRPMPQLSRRS